MITPYIPYADRNKITDPFIAKLTNHLERIVGWDIERVSTHEGHTSINAGKYHIYLSGGIAVLTIDGKTRFELDIKVFEQEYASLISHYKA